MNLKSISLKQPWLKTALSLSVSAALLAGISGCSSSAANAPTTPAVVAPVAAPAATPIQHVVVIFQENVSFEHYFATYPNAANPSTQPKFIAKAGTPAVNNLVTPLNVQNGFAPLTGVNLLTANPTTLNAANGNSAINPFRLDRSQVATADQSHDYNTEQQAVNNGAMDLFPVSVGAGNSASVPLGSLVAPLNTTGLVMGYFDGNTVTALWNYAQNYAMNDNSFGTTFGPSNVGAQNLIAGQTNGVIATNTATVGAASIGGELSSDGNGGITLTGDPQPLGDVCTSRDAVQLSGKNIGDMLNAANVTWGFFEGGFDLSVTNPNGTTGCKRTTTSTYYGVAKVDYIPHHQPFQYYASTANLTHARPTSVASIGYSNVPGTTTADPANHQYDIHDFFDAVSAGNYPSVSFLKAPGYQDGHSGYSTPLDEQVFLTQVVNFLQQQPGWANTMVIIAYDDSDGWYDHQMSPIVNPSKLTEGATSAATANINNAATGNVLVTGNGDYLNGAGVCNLGMTQGTPTPAIALSGANGQSNAQGRCGYGPRLPLLVISPYAKQNYVDHTLTDQSSILRFIEDNWLGSKRITGSFDAIAGTLNNMLNLTGTPNLATLMLDPTSGLPVTCGNCKKAVVPTVK